MRLAAYISFDALSDVTVVLGMRQSIHSKTLSQFISPIPSFKGKTIISQPFFTHFFYDKQNQYFSCLTFLLAALQLHFQFLSILRYQFRGPLFGNRDKDTIINRSKKETPHSFKGQQFEDKYCFIIYIGLWKRILALI